jgi:hypothetical protein
VAGAIHAFAADIANLSARIGREVVVDEAQVTDRSDAIALERPGLWSANRSCRLVRAADGWIVINLPRESDRWMVPAWIGCDMGAEPWDAIVSAVRERPWRRLVTDGRRLGLPVAGVGEVRAPRAGPPLRRMAAGRPRSPDRPLKVVDLSSLWAGPLCGWVLAQAGAEVTKIESSSRPDVAREASPDFFARLNAGKAHAQLDFRDPKDLAALKAAFAQADVVITGARPRAFAQLGLSPEAVFAANPGLVWVAITGYGWRGPSADRVAFGDDAAAAGGLVRWTPSGEPRFLGDALADPLTGFASAASALKAVRRGGGFLVDAAMARVSAGVAAGRAT